jgi:natural product biosynthesis luciferase-like monooxygenase protein
MTLPPTDPNASLRCVLIGADSLLIECGELLRSRGHEVVAVVAGAPKVADWGRRIGVPVHDAGTNEWVEALRGTSIDHLFAITHLAILPDEALTLASRGSINFHDGPLPQYAGLNAPAWALINGEDTYGISWHEITSGIDEGDLLKQQLFDVSPAETSLSINTRNFETAIDTFAELVDELAAGTVQRTPQDLSSPRTTYKRNDRPAALCVLDWRRPAAELERLVRALDFGRYGNPLGSPTLTTAAGAVAVKRAEARDDEPQGEPGEVLEVGDDEIVIATSDGVLALSAFETLAGDEVSVADVAARFGLSVGGRLPLLDDARATELTEIGARLAKAERFFEARLGSIEPVELPWASTATADHVARHVSLPVTVPSSLADRFGAESATAVVAAFATVLARLSGKQQFHVALSTAATASLAATAAPLVSSQVPMAVDLALDQVAAPAVAAIAAELARIEARGSFLFDVVGREPELRKRRELVAGTIAPIAVRLGGTAPVASGTVVELVVAPDPAAGTTLLVDEALVARSDADLFVACFEAVLDSVANQTDIPLSHVDLLGAGLRTQVLESWNHTVVPFPSHACIHHLFEEQVDRTPDVDALVFEDQHISYRDLDARANQVAAHLRSLGIGPDSLVGVHVERGIELMVAVLGVQKAGGAYVPLDPTYPADRLEHMIRDSGCGVIVTLGKLERILPLPEGSTATVLRLDTDWPTIAQHTTERVRADAGPANLAYCIYTSGSTGLPKGVLIEHRNAVNFFTGMDAVVAHDLPATWFAVTSLSFDISVLELLYTLTRGFSVVVYLDHDKLDDDLDGGADAFVPEHGGVPMDFSLFYFSGDEADGHGKGKYRLMLEGAKFADTHGFNAVWTPERHFHAFGGLYPHPAVAGAALAAITENVQIRSGSVVLPLHHPIRVAEQWSMVDNLSNGRVGLSIASGWWPRDFVIMPENYAEAKANMFRDIEKVRALWRGETVTFAGVNGVEEHITTLPRPVQAELPVWVTTAGNPDTFIQAGRIGANVLTHLLGQSVEQLAPKLEAYRQARAEAGYDPDTGIVSLMLHTFIGTDDDEVRELVRQPLKDYLGTSVSLVKEYAWAFPAFQRPEGYDVSNDDDLIASLSPEDTDAVLEFAFLRYYETSGLFGTPESCQPMVDTLKGMGVNEIGCLIDFGVPTDTVLDSLVHLDEAKNIANAPAPSLAAVAHPSSTLDLSPAAQLRRHQVTHLQCTPSMARMFTLEDDTRAALADVAHLYVGGEAFPVQLAKDLVNNSRTGNVTNMYGPTETTIWSTTWKLQGSLDTIPIGTPIANTRIYILDANLQPLPPGVPGDLWIGGDGVVRGYHQRPELTAERFLDDPFVAGGRMYRTGDLAKWRADGSGIIDFLGRIDHQVKIRGYRIELGEIEARLGQHPYVRECVVVVREETPGDQQLVGFVSPKDGAHLQPSELKDHLRVNLPDPMIPGHLVVLDDLPHTPNGKIDRNGLPSLASVLGQRDGNVVVADAENDLERTVLDVWRETLGMQAIGVDDNFFDIGGHSLLVVRMHRRLKEVLERQIPLTELYRFPTIRSFANSLTSDSSSAALQQSADRASRRREHMERRRARAR